MNIVIVTDAWKPQVNGVVNALFITARQLEREGHSVRIIEPSQFTTLPNPTYGEIRLALNPEKKIIDIIETFKSDCLHIATEGPLGLAARVLCAKKKYNFTTSFHTRFDEYLKVRCYIPRTLSQAYLRWFHQPAKAVMYSTKQLRTILESQNIVALKEWKLGVDADFFQPRRKELGFPRPIMIYVGRVAVEKNVQAFLDIDRPGTKIIVGDGPLLSDFKKQYPHVIFTGKKQGVELVELYSSADVFVFPSLTDTFGLVLLEALACGTPVAAFPVTGPIDVITDPEVGDLNFDLKAAINAALECDREHCRRFAMQHSWKIGTQQFLSNLTPLHPS